MDKMSLSEVFDRMDQLHVVVIGDVMLDCYWLGDVERISPEAPVPVVALKKRESRLGGAANVALNCKMLGAKVTIASVVGNDEEGKLLESLLQEAGICTDLVQKSSMRVTTTKTRIMGRHQQMMRLGPDVAHTQQRIHPQLPLDREEVVLVIGIRVAAERSRHPSLRKEGREIDTLGRIRRRGVQRRERQGKWLRVNFAI